MISDYFTNHVDNFCEIIIQSNRPSIFQWSQLLPVPRDKKKVLEADGYLPLNIFFFKFSKIIFSYNNSLPYDF